MNAPMTRYRATELQDNALPWFCWDQTATDKTRPMEWGVTLVPTPIFDEYEDGIGIGDPTHYEWSAMLPEGITLPEWIEVI